MNIVFIAAKSFTRKINMMFSSDQGLPSVYIQ